MAFRSALRGLKYPWGWLDKPTTFNTNQPKDRLRRSRWYCNRWAWVILAKSGFSLTVLSITVFASGGDNLGDAGGGEGGLGMLIVVGLRP